jgi:hypothetical protein
VIAHELHHVLSVDFPVDDPFVHVMTEMAVVVLGGVVLSVGAVMIRNRLRQLG